MRYYTSLSSLLAGWMTSRKQHEWLPKIRCGEFDVGIWFRFVKHKAQLIQRSRAADHDGPPPEIIFSGRVFQKSIRQSRNPTIKML